MTIFNSFLYVYQRVWFVAYSTLKISWIESPAIVFQAAGCSKSSCLAQGPSHRERNQQRLAVFNSGTSTPNWGETPVTNSFFLRGVSLQACCMLCRLWVDPQQRSPQHLAQWLRQQIDRAMLTTEGVRRGCLVAVEFCMWSKAKFTARMSGSCGSMHVTAKFSAATKVMRSHLRIPVVWFVNQSNCRYMQMDLGYGSIPKTSMFLFV